LQPPIQHHHLQQLQRSSANPQRAAAPLEINIDLGGDGDDIPPHALHAPHHKVAVGGGGGGAAAAAPASYMSGLDIVGSLKSSKVCQPLAPAPAHAPVFLLLIAS
jgi:hypothetical protein